MLRQIALFWVALAATFTAQATHLMGGEMTYSFVGMNASGLAEYEVRLAIYRDCSSANTNGTDFDFTASLGVYLDGNWVMTLSSNLDQSLIQNILPEDPNSCAELPDDLCIERGEYVFNVALESSASSYTLTYQRCCRSPALVNLVVPEDQGFTLHTEIPGTALINSPNSSPVFEELPQAFVCNNLAFELNNAATDPDGDSLAYHVCTIYLGGTPLAPIPVPPLGPPFTVVAWETGYNAGAPVASVSGIAIDEQTGLLTGTPLGLGKYAMGVCVEEWRNGVLINSILRDFTLDVVNCALSAPLFAGLTPCNGLEVMFDQTSNLAETYAWDFGFDGPGNTSTDAEPTVTFPEPGIYEVNLAYTNGDCSGETSFEVQAVEPWSVELVAGEATCTDGGWWVPLSAPVDLPEISSYTWQFGSDAMPSGAVDETPEGVLLPPGEVSTLNLVSTSFGCVESDAVVLDLAPLPVADFEVISPPCRGLSVEFVNLEPDLGPFEWWFGDGSYAAATSPVHTYAAYGPYTISVVAAGGTACADTAWQSFSVYPLDPFEPDFDVRPITSCDSVSRVQVTYLGLPSDGLAWDFPGAGLDSGEVVVLAFDQPGVQSGTVSLYHAGCDLMFEVPLEVEAPEPLNEVVYIVPNVFSPNNDGRNERFAIRYESLAGDAALGLTNNSFLFHELAVYNRWGNLMWSTQAALDGWRGDGAAEGTYYVVMESQHACSTSPYGYQGEVTLVR